ncbi:protein-L-isoaspartate(D-aspartate) O-methyltransferase [Spartinivicinus poritis]|uniref:Protein-L-isoaspartate O-methyltransferase n=1 Tax=Spartinivicinus poritis TaxID=2994640 RepID=A0ABT5U5E3_9GAMM|nr:protein-L-isoaspartate(D-aspartate) O-methyltransferase [Spartinivicinus sp. A2-2]MDE1461221.1 protein-L-isoaspartate(D-aspartate) O-methyltransferase [Spartinivicinus sp. A2-2]
MKQWLNDLIYIIIGLTISQLSICYGYEWETMRQEMVQEIVEEVKETSYFIGKSSLYDTVMKAIATVPRHKFVPVSEQPWSYDNRPLPIGYGQTISQPYIVALMTDLLEPDKDDVMLEVGTGSGYQAAVLASLVKQVYTIEIIEELATISSERLAKLGYENIATKFADGYYGWPEYAPFDGIIVTAAAGQIPPPLVKQLKVGGKMIIPVGDQFFTQHLILIEKITDKQITTRQVLPVRFVPLTGKH